MKLIVPIMPRRVCLVPASSSGPARDRRTLDFDINTGPSTNLCVNWLQALHHNDSPQLPHPRPLPMSAARNMKAAIVTTDHDATGSKLFIIGTILWRETQTGLAGSARRGLRKNHDAWVLTQFFSKEAPYTRKAYSADFMLCC